MEHIFGEQGDQGLNQLRQLNVMLRELHKWYDYFALNAFMKHLPTHEWIELEDLEKETKFVKLIKKWGFDFKETIELLIRNEVLYVKRNEDEITHIKRAFNNYGTRIEEEISETVDGRLRDLCNLEDFFIK